MNPMSRNLKSEFRFPSKSPEPNNVGSLPEVHTPIDRPDKRDTYKLRSLTPLKLTPKVIEVNPERLELDVTTEMFFTQRPRCLLRYGDSKRESDLDENNSSVWYNEGRRHINVCKKGTCLPRKEESHCGRWGYVCVRG